MKYAWIETQSTHYPIEGLCRVLEVSRSGFFSWRQRRQKRGAEPDCGISSDGDQSISWIGTT